MGCPSRASGPTCTPHAFTLADYAHYFSGNATRRSSSSAPLHLAAVCSKCTGQSSNAGRSIRAASQRISAPDLRQLLGSRQLIGADPVLGEQWAEQRGRGRRRLRLRPARRVRGGRAPAHAVADHRAGPAATHLSPDACQPAGVARPRHAHPAPPVLQARWPPVEAPPRCRQPPVGLPRGARCESACAARRHACLRVTQCSAWRQPRQASGAHAVRRVTGARKRTALRLPVLQRCRSCLAVPRPAGALMGPHQLQAGLMRQQAAQWQAASLN